jgi:uncharacterized membrane protein
MKNSALLLIYSIINLILCCIFLLFLPQNVAFRFDELFVVTDLISKYYNIILPIVQVVSIIIICLIDIYQKNGKKHTYRYLITYVCFAVASYFTWIMMGIQYFSSQIGLTVRFPINSLIFFVLSYFLFILSYIKIDNKIIKNSIFNFPWIKNNKFVHLKTQRFSARLGILLSIINLILAFLNDILIVSKFLTFFLILLMIIYYLIVVSYSLILKKKYN